MPACQLRERLCPRRSRSTGDSGEAVFLGRRDRRGLDFVKPAGSNGEQLGSVRGHKHGIFQFDDL
jgi:hypothetical protein